MNIERMGLLIDDGDNMLAGTKLPLPPERHLEGLASGI